MENLLGAYGSDEDEHHDAEAQQTGQVTLLHDEDSGGGVDLSHLTSGAAVRQRAEADSAAAAAPGGGGGQQQPGPRPQSAASEQHRDQQQQAGEGGMDVDGGGGGELQAAGGGGEQPPAEDPLAALPPEMREQPEGECDPAVQARVANWLHLQRTRGKYINQEIRKSRGYRNPEFFAKMVEHMEIQQYGTAFDPEVFDPSSLPPEDYLGALQKEWAAEEERRKAARAAGQGRVEFQKSSSQPNLAQPGLKAGLNLPQPPTLQPPPPSAAAAAAAAAAKAAAAMAAAQAHAQAQAQAHGGAAAAAALAAAQARAAQMAAQLNAAHMRR